MDGTEGQGMSTGGVPLCRTAEVLTDGMRKCTAGGMDYLVTQQESAFHVYQHACPHRGGPLSRGRLEGGVVTCPLHASQFDLRTGKLVRGPRVGPNVPWVRKLIARFVRGLREYPSVVKDGTLYLE